MVHTNRVVMWRQLPVLDVCLERAADDRVENDEQIQPGEYVVEHRGFLDSDSKYHCNHRLLYISTYMATSCTRISMATSCAYIYGYFLCLHLWLLPVLTSMATSCAYICYIMLCTFIVSTRQIRCFLLSMR